MDGETMLVCRLDQGGIHVLLVRTDAHGVRANRIEVALDRLARPRPVHLDQRQRRLELVDRHEAFCAEGLDQDLPALGLGGTFFWDQSVLVQQPHQLYLHTGRSIGVLGLYVVVDARAVTLEYLVEGGDLLARVLGAEPAARIAHLYLLERFLAYETPAVALWHPFRR